MTTKDERLRKIAQDFKTKMANQGMEVTGAGPNDEGIPTISVYIHGRDCASRKSKTRRTASGYATVTVPCDCRDVEAE